MNIRMHLQNIVCLICGLVLLSGLIGAQKVEAGTYYVATDGSDSNPGTEEQPFLTLSRGVRDLRPGDTLYVKNGTYIGSSQLADIPSGDSWNNPVTIAGYPGHSPVIVKSEYDYHTLYFTSNSYIVIDGFVIDATNAGHGIKITNDSYGIANHIRIQNSQIFNAQGDGIFVTSGSDGNEFINLQVHNNGTDGLNHGIYIKSSNNIVEGCLIYDNKGWGVHVYSGSGGANNNIIRNNNVYDNSRSQTRGGGIILTSGSGNQAYNNIIWGNMYGIRIDHGASNTYVGGNTIYENIDYSIYIGMGSNDAHIEFNDIYNNYGPSMGDYGVGTLILP
jgi:parallel beta-helix repeat protein